MVSLMVIILVISIISGILYRIGGATGYNTKFRDFGVPTCQVLALLFLLHFKCSVMIWLSLLLSFGFSFASLLSYYKKKETKAKWWNWALVGLTNGLAFLPYCLVSGNWSGFVIRIVILTILTTWWSETQGSVDKEEFGRGFLDTATIPLLLI